MNLAQQKQVFEDMILTNEHQEFIIDLVKSLKSEDSVNDTVKFLTSDRLVALQMKLAKLIRNKTPENAARSLSLLIITLALDVSSNYDDGFDDLGFQK